MLRVASFQDTQKTVRHDTNLQQFLWQHRIVANRQRKSFRASGYGLLIQALVAMVTKFCMAAKFS